MHFTNFINNIRLLQTQFLSDCIFFREIVLHKGYIESSTWRNLSYIFYSPYNVIFIKSNYISDY